MTGRGKYGLRDPNERMTDVAIQAGVGTWTMAEIAALDQALMPTWISWLRDAEVSIRVLRRQFETQLRDEPTQCAECSTPVIGRSSQRYCSATCRIRSQRARQTSQSVTRP